MDEIKEKTKEAKIPEGWKRVRLEEVIKETFSGDWGDEPTENNGVYPVFSTLAIDYKGNIDFKKVTLRRLSLKKINKLKLSKDTILIEKSGGSTNIPAGKVALVKENFLGTCSNFIQIIKTDKKICDSHFLFYRLFYNFKNNLTEKFQQKTTGITNFILKGYWKEVFSIPSLPEQRRIASVLSQMDETIEKETQYKQKLERIKQGLMEDLLTGKVRVNHLLDLKL